MVIDLGEPRDEVELSPRPLSRSQRRAMGATLALATLLSAGGAAAPVRPELVAVTIRATAADHYVVDDDALYLMRPSDVVVRAGLRTITRYRLPDATEPEWEAAIYTAGRVRGASLVDGMLLAVTQAGPDIETIAIRPDTGQEVWRRTGWWYETSAGNGLLLESRAMTQQLFSVELATGTVRWSRIYPAEDPVLIDGERFVHWTKSGTAEVHDSTTGDVLATAHLPLDPELAPQVVGDLLLVPEEDEDGSGLTAYGLDRLDRRWRADVDVRNEYVSGECGDAVCVGVRNDGGIRLVDLATGRTRWSAPGWGYAYPVGPYLFAYGRSETKNPRAALLDPVDGHVVGDLGQWNASLPADDGRMLGIRENGLRTLVARLDPAAAKVKVLGLLAGVFQCQASPVAVVCRRSGGSIGVWYPERRL
ncbi:outer membrane protein assembly factor BamB family protein [Phytohabitans sp. LJ34]|uniref:outer membrane protein assembly factor BamB family protein n=1 Tax=Phytohabitans sp. LJ34 TaxID=3452217 RepID=UPI003F892642